MPLDLPFPSLDGGQNDSFTWVTRGVKWAGPPTQKNMAWSIMREVEDHALCSGASPPNYHVVLNLKKSN